MTRDGGGGPADGDVEIDALRERVAALVADWDDVESVTMFGLPSFTAREELFCVVSEQGVSLTRLPDGARTALAGQTTVASFEAGDRTVESWATVAPGDLPDDETLERFLRASYEVAQEEAVG